MKTALILISFFLLVLSICLSASGLTLYAVFPRSGGCVLFVLLLYYKGKGMVTIKQVYFRFILPA